MFVIRYLDGSTVRFSTAAACVAALRRGGARLVVGEPADLIALARAEQEAFWDALRPEALTQ